MGVESFIANRLATIKAKTFTRTIVNMAVVSIALSIAVMIISATVIDGFARDIHNKVFGFWGNIHLTSAAVSKNFEPIPIDLSLPYYQELSQIDRVEYVAFDDESGDEEARVTSGGINHVQPFIILPGLIETDLAFQAILFKGVDTSYNWSNMSQYSMYDTKLSISNPNDIIISKNIAEKLTLEVGQHIILSFIQDRNRLRRKLYIKGIYNTGLEEYDQRFIIGNINVLRDILVWDSMTASGIEIFVDDVEDTKVISDYVHEEVIPLDMYSETIEQKFPNIFEWLKLQDINETVIYQLMTIVAIINMITIILILVLERTKMIGTLKALGASNKMVKRIFLLQAGHILWRGLLIGNILGLGLAFIQKRFGILKLDEKSYYLDTAPIYVDWLKIILINLGAAACILVALLLPIIVISSVTPVKALRFD